MPTLPELRGRSDQNNFPSAAMLIVNLNMLVATVKIGYSGL